jgi:hypothetical protein
MMIEKLGRPWIRMIPAWSAIPLHIRYGHSFFFATMPAQRSSSRTMMLHVSAANIEPCATMKRTTGCKYAGAPNEGCVNQ